MNPVHGVLVALTGIGLFAGLSNLVLALRTGGRRQFVWFGLAALAYAVYAWTALLMYTATSEAGFRLALQQHLVANFLGATAFVWFVQRFAGRESPRIPWALTALAGVLLILEVLLPTGLFYGTPATLIQVSLSNGYEVSVLQGPALPWAPLVRLHIYAVGLFLLGSGVGLWRSGRRRPAAILLLGFMLAAAGIAWDLVFNRFPMSTYPVDEVVFMAMILVTALGLSDDLVSGLEASQILQTTEARLQFIVDNAPEAIVLLNMGTMTFSRVNAAARALFQAEEGDFLSARPGRFSPEFQPDGSRSDELIKELLAAALRDEKPRADWIIRTKYGDLVPCELRFVRLPGEDPPVIRVSLINLTERKSFELREAELEAQVRQTQKLETVGTLTSGIAHDFNNLLQPILAYTEMALESLDPKDPVREDLEQVFVAAERARDLVRQLLSFSRRTGPGEKVTDLNLAIRETVGLLRAAARAAIVIESSSQVESAFVAGDASQLQQVLMNLGTNALQAMDEGPGRVSIRVDEVEVPHDLRAREPDLAGTRALRVRVEDTGKGMSPGLIERVFDPFFTTKPVGAGTGLGLAVVHGIVRGMGGVIEVESRSGTGTTFSLLLPRAAPPEAALPAVEPAGPEAWGRILVVDDQVAVAQATADLLIAAGFEAVAETSARHALDRFLVRPGDWAGAVVDYDMPELNGLELVREFRKRVPLFPVVVMTGADRLEPARVAEAGAILLRKPFGRPELLQALYTARE